MINYQWPESFIEPYENYYIPSYLKNIGVMSDIHIPYHFHPALDEAINYFIQKSVDSILLNGDIVDAYPLSKFNPDPRNRKWWEEIEAFKDFIKMLQSAMPGVKIYYKMGNHDERYEKKMIEKCPEFLGIKEFEFSNIMGITELGIELIEDQRIVYVGKLPVLHGHEIALKSAIVNPARSLFLKTFKSGMCGHLHKTSEHTEQALDGKIITCFSTGHMGDPHPRFARLNRWNHGCARIEKDEEGNFEVINIRLLKNKLFNPNA